MKNKTFSLDQEVYLPQLRQFGSVKAINVLGQPTKVEVLTPDGPKIIDTLNLIVTIVNIVQVGILPALRLIVKEVKSWFA